MYNTTIDYKNALIQKNNDVINPYSSILSLIEKNNTVEFKINPTDGLSFKGNSEVAMFAIFTLGIIGLCALYKY